MATLHGLLLRFSDSDTSNVSYGQLALRYYHIEPCKGCTVPIVKGPLFWKDLHLQYHLG
jgi:hypothetical protein